MSVLSELFGEGAQLKVLETFVENYNDKLYAADIIRMTDVSKVTVAKHIRKLLDEGIIDKKEKAGVIQFYQLNLNNPKAKIILLLEQYIVSERLKKAVEEEVGEEDTKRPWRIESSCSVSPNEYLNRPLFAKSESESEPIGFNPMLKTQYLIGQAVTDASLYAILERGVTNYE